MYTITCVRSGMCKKHRTINGVKCVSLYYNTKRVPKYPSFKRHLDTLDEVVTFIVQSYPALFFPQLKTELNTEEQQYVFSKLNSYMRNHVYDIRGIRRLGIQIMEHGHLHNYMPVDEAMKSRLGIEDYKEF